MKEGDDLITVTNISGTTTSISLRPDYVTYNVGDVFRDSDNEGIGARLDRLEAVFGIGQRNTALEQKYPELKQAGDDYHEEIAHIFEDIRKQNQIALKEYLAIQEECYVMEKLKENND